MKKQTPKRGTPRRASTALARSKKKPAPKTTALARRAPGPGPITLLKQASAEQALATLADLPTMAAQFVGTLKLDEDQIKSLRRPVEDHEIEWKPLKKDGPPAIPYLSHNGYRDRLDAAFGLGGWGMVPVGLPKEKDDVVLVPFALVVAGVPRIYVWGEQMYEKSNRQMTYGDALEGAKSNAIMRAGKELGVAREMWNRRHLAGLKDRLLGDQGGRGSRRSSAPADDREQAPREPRGHHHPAGQTISDAQRRRLWVIIRNSGRDEGEVKSWLEKRYGWTSSTQVTRREYDFVCEAIESTRALPLGGNE